MRSDSRFESRSTGSAWATRVQNGFRFSTERKRSTVAGAKIVSEGGRDGNPEKLKPVLEQVIRVVEVGWIDHTPSTPIPDPSGTHQRSLSDPSGRDRTPLWDPCREDEGGTHVEKIKRK